jgi:hypothetical protein
MAKKRKINRETVKRATKGQLRAENRKFKTPQNFESLCENTAIKPKNK